MELIAHRINTVEELRKLPNKYGVEIDLRDFGNRLILQHDPFKDGESFQDYLKAYDHGTMILNIKSERIEHRVLELIQKYNVENYFFLDSTFPMINLLVNEDERNIAIRFSEFEGIDTILNMKDKVQWIWVDCFSRLPITRKNYDLIRKNGFKFCLVSPELQGQPEKIGKYKKYLRENGIFLDAICTKKYNFHNWSED